MYAAGNGSLSGLDPVSARSAPAAAPWEMAGSGSGRSW